jgi:hypothetical protein
MGRQITYITLTSDDTIDGWVNTRPAWDTMSSMERLDLLADWRGEITRLYDAEYKMWGRELKARRDENESIVRHLIGEIDRLEADNNTLRCELAYEMKKSKP